MGSVLSQSIGSDLHCVSEDADLLARLARDHLAYLVGGEEDSDEDRILRLRDPRVFGEFAESILEDHRLSAGTRTAVVERAFDILPLPRTEGEVILVGTRGPPRLLALAAFLVEQDSFTVLHAMHLVYAVFLDRALLANVPRAIRDAVLSRILDLTEADNDLRLLYLAMHLGAVPESEAYDGLRRMLRSRIVPDSFKQAAAEMVSSEDGGVSVLMEIAQQVGLLPAELGDSDAPEVVVNIPRMPVCLASLGARWLSRHRGPAIV